MSKGYEAVIAPYWVLNINIPPIWLPEFIGALNAGMTAGESFYIAGQKVYEETPAVGAWGCLHFYGNPFIKVKPD